MVKHLTIRVTGQVQNVGFRYSTKEVAERLGLYGFVRNEPDGTVLVEAEAEEEKLQQFINWCQKGTEFTNIEKVEHISGKIQGYSDFQIV